MPWVRCIPKHRSAHTHTQTTRPGHLKSFLLSPHITCTTLKTALCTGVPLLASPLSEPSPLPSAPARPLQAQQAPASAPRFSPALTPCLPLLLHSTIQTSTLLYRPGRPPYPQNSTRLLRSHVWRVRFLSLLSPYFLHTLSLCLTSCLRARLSVSLTVFFCLCSLDMVAFALQSLFQPGGFADLKELGNCSFFMYQKAAACRSSDTSYRHCPFKSAKGHQKGNSCSCQRVSRVTLITLFTLFLFVFLYLSVYVSVVSSPSPGCVLFSFCFCTVC